MKDVSVNNFLSFFFLFIIEMSVSMNTFTKSLVAVEIRKQREMLGHTQPTFAKLLGVSHAQVSFLENLKDNRITPSMNASFKNIGINLEEMVKGLMIHKVRGKDRTFHTDLSISMKKKDPLKLLEEATKLIKDANLIISDKFIEIDEDIKNKQDAIKVLDDLKKDISAKRDAYLTEILDTKPLK
jgi:DNA-binding XRE family transcriptional regulator